jgi:phosphatidylserine decarboxylase
MRIHKEGFRILAIAFVLLAAICGLFWYTLGLIAFAIVLIISLLFYIFILRFFRNPTRVEKHDDEWVFSPCDGTVVAIEEVDESEFIKTKCIQISIFMSVWNVHINWNPIGGKVVFQKYHPGKFLVAWEPKSSTLNERTSIAIERPDGVKVLFRQIAGFLARRIVCYSKAGDDAGQGQQMGFIKFGSRVDVFLPLNASVKVELNQKVVGTQTGIAVIPKA